MIPLIKLGFVITSCCVKLDPVAYNFQPNLNLVCVCYVADTRLLAVCFHYFLVLKNQIAICYCMLLEALMFLES